MVTKGKHEEAKQHCKLVIRISLKELQFQISYNKTYFFTYIDRLLSTRSVDEWNKRSTTNWYNMQTLTELKQNEVKKNKTAVARLAQLGESAHPPPATPAKIW